MPVRIQRKRTAGWQTPLCTCGCGHLEALGGAR